MKEARIEVGPPDAAPPVWMHAHLMGKPSDLLVLEQIAARHLGKLTLADLVGRDLSENLAQPDAVNWT